MGIRRAYLAGTGATGALIAGAVIVFLSAAAFVAFNGFSFPASSEQSSASVAVAARQTQEIAAAPRAAAASVAPGAAAVAATPTPTLAATSARVITTATDGTPITPIVTRGPLPPPIPGDGDEPPAPPTDDGPITGITDTVDHTTGPLGLPAVGPLTDPLTSQVDQTATTTLNRVGGLVGNSELGDQTVDNVSRLTHRLLGG